MKPADSAMDNVEWTDRYGARFGMVYVDFKTQKRTPKVDRMWFKGGPERNAVVRAAYCRG